MKEGISGTEDIIEEMVTQVKETILFKKKTQDTKHPRNLRQHKMSKYKDNRNRGRKIIPNQCSRKYLNKIIGKKFPNLKKNMPINTSHHQEQILQQDKRWKMIFQANELRK